MSLNAGSFSAYPEQARHTAEAHLDLLRRLPLSFLPLLLRELIVFDWKFPAERRDLLNQFEYLKKLKPEEFQQAFKAFNALRLTPALEGLDWVNSPAAFSEQLTAHLWATHQIESFRAAAVDYVKNSTPTPAPLPTHRLCIVGLGQGTAHFQKLAPKGTLYTNVQHSGGLQTLLAAVRIRATAYPEPYAHWLIDGGSEATIPSSTVTQISFGALSPVRAILQARMRKSYEAGVFNPETFRSNMARTQPEDLGLASPAADPILSRFELSLLTEGSGTQVFSTTFVQWAAREVLRRAQPLTLFARFTPRQREKPMNELLAEAQSKPDLDPEGSLIDAEMGAYYTWVNQQRLQGAEQATFLVWQENQALVIAPSQKPNTRTTSPTTLTKLISEIT